MNIGFSVFLEEEKIRDTFLLVYVTKYTIIVYVTKYNNFTVEILLSSILSFIVSFFL